MLAVWSSWAGHWCVCVCSPHRTHTTSSTTLNRSTQDSCYSTQATGGVNSVCVIQTEPFSLLPPVPGLLAAQAVLLHDSLWRTTTCHLELGSSVSLTTLATQTRCTDSSVSRVWGMGLWGCGVWSVGVWSMERCGQWGGLVSRSVWRCGQLV